MSVEGVREGKTSEQEGMMKTPLFRIGGERKGVHWGNSVFVEQIRRRNSVIRGGKILQQKRNQGVEKFSTEGTETRGKENVISEKSKEFTIYRRGKI